jgi:predicted transcriptional regulator YdeE
MQEPKIVSKPAFTIVGLKYRGKNEGNEIPALWQTFMARAQPDQNVPSQPGSALAGPATPATG